MGIVDEFANVTKQYTGWSNVSVNLVFTIENSDAQRLFDHPVKWPIIKTLCFCFLNYFCSLLND